MFGKYEKRRADMKKTETIKIRAVLGKIGRWLISLLPFLLMDFFVRLYASRISYHVPSITLPNILFTASWLVLILALSLCFTKKTGRVIYGVIFAAYFAVFLTQLLYFSRTDFFFSFHLLESTSEGSAYIIDTLIKASQLTYFASATVLAFGVLAIVMFRGSRKIAWKTLFSILVLFVLLHLFIPHLLGKANENLEWDTWRNPRNVYESFGDSNKNVKICGFYEYTARDFYVTFIRSDKDEKPEELEFLRTAYSTETPHAENAYTGLFKGNNVIFLQLEGIDSWLLTEEDMPNLYGMMKNSLVFDNHYSYYTGGGSTFNSELAVTTGFVTPLSYAKNPYAFNKNSYPDSLPRKLREMGYSANAFHMNNGEYYMRAANYKNWGYEKYYSLLDDCSYTDDSYMLDRELIENPVFYENMFKKDAPFMNYVITFTPHTPFDITTEHGKLLAEKVYGESAVGMQMTEEESARLMASETDNMVGLLLAALRREGLYEDTVIVVFADHYLYSLNDKSILDKYKVTENNLINHTPFFIWSADVTETHIEKVNSQIDILPTVLNLLGAEYCDERYIGRDIMDENYPGYVFFADYSWFDGENYVELGEVRSDASVDLKYVSDMNTKINDIIKRNDLTLKYDYFGR